jgi:hypothetical protein
MAHKKVLFRSDAREGILKGVNALADAVRVTLGPKSKSVLIEKKFGAPLVCNDGVTIAKEMDLEDPVENLGAQMIRQAAERTGDAVGDGTSTATILAQAIFTDGVRNVVAGASAVREPASSAAAILRGSRSRAGATTTPQPGPFTRARREWPARPAAGGAGSRGRPSRPRRAA